MKKKILSRRRFTDDPSENKSKSIFLSMRAIISQNIYKYFFGGSLNRFPCVLINLNILFLLNGFWLDVYYAELGIESNWIKLNLLLGPWQTQFSHSIILNLLLIKMGHWACHEEFFILYKVFLHLTRLFRIYQNVTITKRQ